ncbi:MAG: metallophosphoesterase [Candidatus Geothermarchaeales archaeon]
MRIGLISDTHDNPTSVKRAVEIFNDEGVEVVLHAGDHIAPFSVGWFKPLEARLIGVGGNLDAEYEILGRSYEENGWEFHRHFASLELGGRVALLHGVSNQIVVGLAKSGDFDVVVRGHMHQKQFERLEGSLLVNPGEACGYLTGEASIAILEMPAGEVRFLSLV